MYFSLSECGLFYRIDYMMHHKPNLNMFQFSSVCSVVSNSLNPMDCPVHHQLPELAQTHVHWVGDAISSSVVPFSCLQSFPVSGSFLNSQFFVSDGQSIGVSASASVLPMNIQDWWPLGWTGWISLQSKGLSSIFSNTSLKASILQHSAFFIARLSQPYWLLAGFNSIYPLE